MSAIWKSDVFFSALRAKTNTLLMNTFTAIHVMYCFSASLSRGTRAEQHKNRLHQIEYEKGDEKSYFIFFTKKIIKNTYELNASLIKYLETRDFDEVKPIYDGKKPLAVCKPFCKPFDWTFFVQPFQRTPLCKRFLSFEIGSTKTKATWKSIVLWRTSKR